MIARNNWRMKCVCMHRTWVGKRTVKPPYPGDHWRFLTSFLNPSQLSKGQQSGKGLHRLCPAQILDLIYIGKPIDCAHVTVWHCGVAWTYDMPSLVFQLLCQMKFILPRKVPSATQKVKLFYIWKIINMSLAAFKRVDLICVFFARHVGKQCPGF